MRTTISVDPRILEAIDAQRADVSRSRYLEGLLAIILDELAQTAISPEAASPREASK